MDVPTINHIELCAGIGSMGIGLKAAIPNLRTVCYVEWDSYAAATLVARMEEQALDEAPVWDNLTTFDGECWRGSVDIISAGFPCQPWSKANPKRKGQKDERWLWPDIAQIVWEVQPEWIFLENVLGLLNGGIGTILSDLCSIGFDAEWCCLSAGNVGASQKRNRTFILGKNPLANPGSDRLERLRSGWGQDIRAGEAEVHAGSSRDGLFAPGTEAGTWQDLLRHSPHLEPSVCRISDGSASLLQHASDRIRVLGNGVVPLQVAAAFIELASRMEEQ